MGPQKLALQQWVQGQILEPQHFRASEEATTALACLVGELRGLPFHGLGRLAWDEAALAKGCISISALTLVLPGGTLIDVPGNAAVSDLELTKIAPRGGTVYLHLLDEMEGMPRTGAYEGDPREVKRSRFKLRLSLDNALVGARMVYPLVEIVCEKLGGAFKRSPDHAPPLISAFGHPFLSEKLTALRKILSDLRKSFAKQLEDPLFRGERAASARSCAGAAVRIEILFVESEHGIMPHAHVLFEATRALWIELMALREHEIHDLPIYDHEHPAVCFEDLVKRLRTLAAGEPVLSPNKLAFSREADDQPFIARDFSPALKQATEVYLVVERTPDRVPLGALKLASPERIDRVIRQSLPGVTAELVKAPPRHAFGPMVDFHLLDTSADEWKQAVAASALAYRPSTALAKARTTLYWRSLEASQGA